MCRACQTLSKDVCLDKSLEKCVRGKVQSLYDFDIFPYEKLLTVAKTMLKS